MLSEFESHRGHMDNHGDKIPCSCNLCIYQYAATTSSSNAITSERQIHYKIVAEARKAELLKYIEGSPIKINVLSELLPEKDKAVTQLDADAILREELAFKKQEDLLVQKRAAMASIGDEPTDTKYIAFAKAFIPGATLYSYAAVKVGDHGWHSTANSSTSGQTFSSWDDLVYWLVSGPVPTDKVTPLYPGADSDN